MKLKSLILTSIMSSVLAIVPTTLMASENKLKVAIIKSEDSTANLSQNEYKEIIANLSNQKKKSKYREFEKNTALCVAYLKTKNNIQSESACTSAIKSAQTLNIHNRKTNYLKSISYSNRAVSRYLNDDINGAMSDLAQATAIDSNNISTANLAIMNSQFEHSNYNDSVSLAD
jgi:hypothetical protein